MVLSFCDRILIPAPRCSFPADGRMCYNREAVKQDGKLIPPAGLRGMAVAESPANSPADNSAAELQENTVPVLPGLFAAAGVEKVQAGLRSMRVLHVLRGLLLAPSGRSQGVKTALR